MLCHANAAKNGSDDFSARSAAENFFKSALLCKYPSLLLRPSQLSQFKWKSVILTVYFKRKCTHVTAYETAETKRLLSYNLLPNALA